MKKFERVSAFSQNAGLNATQTSKEYIAFEMSSVNKRYIEELLLLPEEQAFNALAELRSKVYNASAQEWLTYGDISEYFPVILKLAVLYYNGDIDFLSFGENVTVVNKAFNEAIRRNQCSVRIKKEQDSKRTARILRKIFKSNPTDSLFEAICLISECF